MRYSILFVLFIFLSACNISSNYESFINTQLTSYCDDISQYTEVIIIPRQGCHSCVEKADEYFLKNKDRKDCLFIFTHLISEKALRIEVGKENLILPNVKVDKDDRFYSLKYADSQYPIVLTKGEDGHFTYSFLDVL